MGGAAARSSAGARQEAPAPAPGLAKYPWLRSCGATPHPNLPPQGGKGLRRAIFLALVAALLVSPAHAQDVLTETRITQFGAWQDAASAIFTIDSSTDTEVFAPILEAFARRVPDVAIRYREITTNELYQLAESGCRGSAQAAEPVVR